MTKMKLRGFNPLTSLNLSNILANHRKFAAKMRIYHRMTLFEKSRYLSLK